jgi:hypothetical protein
VASQTVKTGVGIGAAHKDTTQPVTVTPPCVRTKDVTKGA